MHAAFPSSRYALHLRRWLQVFPHESILLLRFDEVSSKIHRYCPNQPDACKEFACLRPQIVLQPFDVLQRVAAFLQLPPFSPDFVTESARGNFTTIEGVFSYSESLPAGPSQQVPDAPRHVSFRCLSPAR